MDDTDHQLIVLLRANARAPVATSARQLKLARGTAQNRLAKLEAAGTSWPSCTPRVWRRLTACSAASA